MKRLATLFFILTYSLIIQAQGWTYYDLNLNASNEVYDFQYDGLSKVYMNSEQGLCIYDLQNEQYDTCIIGTGGVLMSNNRKLLLSNGVAWAITPNGLSSFDGHSLKNFTSVQGLPSNSINDIALNSSGTLWAATTAGLAYFNGSSFVLDTSLVAKFIAFDNRDRLYACAQNIIAVGGPTTMSRLSIRDMNTWTSVPVSGIDSLQKGGPVLNVQKFKLIGNHLGIVSASTSEGYYRITYPAVIDKQPIERQGVTQNLNFKDTEVDSKGNIWVVAATGISHLHSTKDSVLLQHYLGYSRKSNHTNYSNEARLMQIVDSTIIVYTRNGLYKASSTIEPLTTLKEELSVNSIRTGVSILGQLFNDYENTRSFFEFPKGNNSHGIYSSNFMLVSKSLGDTSFTVNQLSPYDNNFIAGPVSDFNGVSGSWIVKVSQSDIQNHKSNYMSPNYVVPENIANWKGNGDVNIGMAAQLAPFEDLNNNGVYEPQLGDAPIIKGDEAIYWINHIGDIEYHGMLYGFNRPSDAAIHQSLYLSMELFNRSNIQIDSAKLGFYTDFDLGNPLDDYVGCDSLKNIFFAYNGDAFDDGFNGQSGFGGSPPFIGVKFLSDSMDGFLYYNAGGALNGDPRTDEHWVNYLNGKWKNGQFMRYGGDGLNNTFGVPTKYLYTGTPWAEESPGPNLNPNAPGDRRGMGHIPWFSLQPNQSKSIEMVIGYAQIPNSGHLGSKSLLIQYLDSAANFWEQNTITGVQEVQVQSNAEFLTFYPNPANEAVIIKLTDNQMNHTNEYIRVYAMDGRMVYRERISNQKMLIDLSQFEKGIYLVQFKNQVQKLVKQ
tara:strand:- start:8071 stop:10548 length:2478 start_codon:yes stop_codon:yes gene_type:complete